MNFESAVQKLSELHQAFKSQDQKLLESLQPLLTKAFLTQDSD
jgi:hypothetical protein